MKKSARFEMVYQISALVLSIIVVHLVYISLIRPNADAILFHHCSIESDLKTQLIHDILCHFDIGNRSGFPY